MRVHSLSWVDPDEWDEALSRAGISTRAAEARKLGAHEYEYWPTIGAPTAPPQPEAALPPRATETRSATAEKKKEEVATYMPPPGSLSTRLEDYLRWVLERTGCRQTFVADADGLVLMDSNADPDLVAISSMFISVLNRVDASLSSPIRSSVVIDLEAGGSLHVVQAETALGPYSLGFAVPRPVSREMVDSARNGLVRVLSPMENIELEEEGPSDSYGDVPRTTEMNKLIARRRNEPL